MTGATVSGMGVVPKEGEGELWLISITKGGCETETHPWGRGVKNKAGSLDSEGLCSLEKKKTAVQCWVILGIVNAWPSGRPMGGPLSAVPGVSR